MSLHEPYSPPQLQVRTFAQAAVFLTGHAWIGDEGARDLLELMFSLPAQGLVTTGSLSASVSGLDRAQTWDQK